MKQDHKYLCYVIIMFKNDHNDYDTIEDILYFKSVKDILNYFDSFNNQDCKVNVFYKRLW